MLDLRFFRLGEAADPSSSSGLVVSSVLDNATGCTEAMTIGLASFDVVCGR